MKDIGSVHQFILEIQPISKSYNLRGTPIFYPSHLKIIEVILNSHEFVKACKKLVYSISLKYSQFLTHGTRVATSIFLLSPLINF